MSQAYQDVNTYNSDGRIIQVEYAMKAMNLGTTTIGIKLKDCAILISEKKLVSPLQNPLSVKKHFKIYDNICAGISGISGDAPTIIEKCISMAINHEKIYNEQISTEDLVERICSLALKFSEEELDDKIFSRPFGVSILVASFDKEPKLFSIDSSGSYLGYKAKAIGSAQEVLNQLLEKSYEEFSGREDAVRRGLQMLKNVMKDPITENNVELSIVDKDGVFILTPAQISKYL